MGFPAVARSAGDHGGWSRVERSRDARSDGRPEWAEHGGSSAEADEGNGVVQRKREPMAVVVPPHGEEKGTSGDVWLRRRPELGAQ